jgi:hypothetical protein
MNKSSTCASNCTAEAWCSLPCPVSLLSLMLQPQLMLLHLLLCTPEEGADPGSSPQHSCNLQAATQDILVHETRPTHTCMHLIGGALLRIACCYIPRICQPASMLHVVLQQACRLCSPFSTQHTMHAAPAMHTVPSLCCACNAFAAAQCPP